MNKSGVGRNMRRGYRWLGAMLMSFILLLPVLGRAATCPYFPGPVQSKETTGLLTLNGTIRATPGDAIRFPTITIGGSGRHYCDLAQKDGASCSLIKAAVAPIALPAFKFVVNGTNVNADGPVTLTGNQYGAIQINSGGSVTLQPSSFPALIDSINIDGKLAIAPGEYWIRNLQINNGFFDLLNDGTLTLYVNGNTTFNRDLPTNISPNRKIILIAYDQVTLNGSSVLGAAVYSQKGTSTINGKVVGPVTVASVLNMNGSSEIDARNWRDYSTLMGECQVTSQVDHYELSYPAESLNCEPAAITLKACQNSACDQFYTSQASVTLTATPSPVSGVAPSWSTNPVTFTQQSSGLTLSYPKPGTVTLGISAGAPAPVNGLKCYRGGLLDSSCSLNFVESMLSFNVPTLYAGQESGDVLLRAIRSTPQGTTSVCTAALTGPQNVNFSRTYAQPASGSRNPTVRNNTTATATPVTSNSVVPVTFSSSGEAYIRVAYTDAGALGLTASWGSGNLSLSGSDTFAALPTLIRLRAATAPVCNGSSDTEYAACSVFQRTGDAFPLTAEAGYLQGSSFILTPNFTTNGSGAAATPLGWQHELLAPSAGVTPAQPTSKFDLTSGTVTMNVASDEVGVYRYWIPTFYPYASYQDATLLPVPRADLATTVTRSAAVGRFVPTDFLLTQGQVSPSCAGFSYMEQPFGYGLTLTARNSKGAMTQNYRGAFAKGSLGLVAENGDDGVALTSRLSAAATLAWQSGMASVSNQALIFHRQTNGQPDGPFSLLALGAQVADNESPVFSRIANPDMKATQAGSCALSGCDAVTLGALDLRYGRLLASSVNGPGESTLTLPLYMQYWQGSAQGFQVNGVDNCTQLPSASLQLNGQSVASWSSIPLRDGSGSSGVSAPVPGYFMPTAGRYALVFAAPGAGQGGYVELVPLTTLPEWMKALWQGSSLSGFPPARATFGTYRGNDRLIYRRELLN